jgi:hypothetical protein
VGDHSVRLAQDLAGVSPGQCGCYVSLLAKAPVKAKTGANWESALEAVGSQFISSVRNHAFYTGK